MDRLGIRKVRITGGEPLVRKDLPRFTRLLADTPGIALVVFTSPDCGGCRHLRRVLRQVQTAQPRWRLYEVDAQQDPGLVNEFEVFHLPTLFVFQNGEFHCQLSAEARPVAIVSATLEALGGPAEEAP